MNKQDLVSVVSETADISRVKSAEVLDAVFDAIAEALRREGEVRLTNFGTFTLSTRKAGMGRNPRTGESIPVPALTTVRFKPGKALKDSLLGE